MAFMFCLSDFPIINDFIMIKVIQFPISLGKHLLKWLALLTYWKMRLFKVIFVHFT